MKRILLLFVFASFFANAQNWKAHPKKPYSPTDSCLVWQDSTKKFYRIKCSEISGSAVIDTTKVGRIEQGRGTAPIFMYFNGTSWVRNDTSYIPRIGASNITGNLKSNQSYFELGLSSGNNNVQFSEGVYTKLTSSNGLNINGVLQSYSTGLGYSEIGVNNSTSGYSRVLAVNGSSTTTPDLSFKFDKGIAWYNGDYSAQMETNQNLIPSLKKVKQLISDSLSSGGGGSVNASNGLSLAGDTVKLGGTLNDTTIINTNNNTLTLNALSTDANKEVLSINRGVNNIFAVNNIGDGVISIGKDAGASSTSASSSVMLGYEAGQGAAIIGGSNIIGHQSGDVGTGNISGSNIIGQSTGADGLSIVSSNIIGHFAANATYGITNCNILGSNAGSDQLNANYLRNSILIGNSAAYNNNVNTTNGGIIHIGNYTNSAGYYNTVAIGDSATSTKLNQVAFSPKFRHLRFRGIDYELPSTQGAANTYLQNNGSGVLSWAAGGGGSGTVTSVSVTTANGVSGTVATSTTTPAISLTLGAITPTSVNGVTLSGSSTPSITVVGSSSLAGSNTGDQTSVTGNAGTATALQNSRLIGIATGDVASSGASFNGTANNTNIYTLATVNSNVGTFGSATQTPVLVANAKGLITSVSNTTITPAIGSVTGLGTGVSTWLATPSSANLRTAVTDETGTGVAVFGTSPTFTTDITTPLIIGGTSTTSGITYKSTTGVGTTGADHTFQVGNNGATTAMTITNSAMVGIGITNPLAQLHVSSDVTSAIRGLVIDQHSTDAASAPLVFRKSRGTLLSPTIVTDQDYIGVLSFTPYDGASYLQTAGFGGRVNGTVTAGSVPTDLFFYTGSANLTNPYVSGNVRMVINSSGNVGIGTTTPQSKLDVEGAVSIGATYSGTTAAPANGLLVEGLVGIGTSNPTVSLDVSSKTDAIRIANGTTAQRTTAASGLFRFNTTTSRFEGNDGTSWNTFTESIFPIMCSAPSSTYAASTTYYMGSAAFAGTLTSTANQRVMQIPFNATLIGASIGTRSGTPGSSETSTVYMRVNNTTDVQLTNTMSFASANTNQYTSALNTDVSAGDTYEVKLTTGAFTAAPATSFVTVMLYFKRR